MSNSKLVTLGHLTTGLQAAKNYSDKGDSALYERIAAVAEDVADIVATGGEPNLLNGVKVNGDLLPITDKIVELLIAAGTENGTISVNGAAVAITGLKNLAFLDKVSENELSDSLKASIAALATNADLTALEVRVTTAEGKIQTLESAGFQTAADVQAAIAAANHLKYAIVETLPEASAADANTWYLLYNEESTHYDIYGLINGALRIIDDTTIDLTGYVKEDVMRSFVAQEIATLNVDQFATDAEMAAAIARIAELEGSIANVYTKAEAEAKFTDETEAQTIAETAASAAVEAAKAADDAVDSAVAGVFNSEV